MDNYDVLIIGSGIAGITTAIKCAESNLKVAMITRESSPETTNTLWAQGGIIYPKGEKPEILMEDIQKASAYTSSPEALKVFCENASEVVEEYLLGKAKTNFRKEENGEFAFTKEAAHSVPRILFQGDHTGRELQLSLLNYLAFSGRFPNVDILSNLTAIDLITPSHHGSTIAQRYEEYKVVGAYVYDRDENNVRKLMAKKTVLATGGVSALYLHHSNSKGARGDGHAMAKRAGARLINMEFIQFHPTTFFNRSSHKRFLITEALRGEGGKLIDFKGNQFMKLYHPDRELAPRDVVARAIQNEMIDSGHDCVYLDISFKKEGWIKDRFPSVYQHCLENGIDITKEPIPVVPAAHYSCGGVHVDSRGRTNLKNLYAVGEVACTGVHGANRLASTSLLEGLVWGHLAGVDVVKSVGRTDFYNSKFIKSWVYGNQEEYDGALVAQDWNSLRQTLWNYVGLERSTPRLKRANAMFTELYSEINRFYRHAQLSDELIGLRNAVEVALLITDASMRNKKSVGCFYLKNSN